jgi:cytochrome P450
MVEASMRPTGAMIGFFEPGSRPRRLPVTPWGRLQRRIDATRDLLDDEIRLRRADPEVDRRDDVFSLLVGAVDDDEELGDELMSLLLAGAESSATTLAWAFDFLLHDSTALARVRDDDEAYLEAVLQETLRLRPVAHLTGRRLTGPLQLNGYLLPAGTTVAIPAYLVHRRADVYPDPERFRPERFLDRPPGAFAWVPFGGGARRCVGASFAMLEMKCVLATVLRAVELRSASRRRERVRMRNIILTPARGVRVRRPG